MALNQTYLLDEKTVDTVLRSAKNKRNGALCNGGSSMGGLTLSQAAKVLGKSKSTLNRAIKTGRLSATRNEDGTFSIDPAELYRAFPAPLQNVRHEPQTERIRTVPQSDLNNRINLLEQLLEKERDTSAREREIAADLREDRDKWRQQATSLLADQRPGSSEQASAKRRSWWPFNR